MLICGEWTYVDTKMKLLVESDWKCCFQVSIRFHCWTTAVRIQSLTFAFWCFTDVLRICTNSLASLDWNTSEILTDIAFEAWQNLPHSGCNEFHASAVFIWARIMSPQYQWNIYINYLNTHYRMHPWGCNVPGRFIIICRSRLLQNATRLHQIHYK